MHPLCTTQPWKTCIILGFYNTRMMPEIATPTTEAIQQVCMKIAKSLCKKMFFIDSGILAGAAICYHCTMRPPHGEKMLILVPCTVTLEIERLFQGSKQACRAFGKVTGSRQYSQTRRSHPHFFKLL
mmetsp:Transcript_66771/g.127173  ORF Transcript_66771/g.127173 Transcript_66771/m.127173 type:complete len:127 (+) Transcript_66771:111-491(+)